MSASPSLRAHRFHTSIASVAGAVVLCVAVQTLVAAAEEPLHHVAISVINFMIAQGRFNILLIPATHLRWTAIVEYLGLSLISVGAGLAIAYWANRKTGLQ